MIALVGLGNPGKQYKNNRHNIGYLAIDEIIKTHDIDSQKNKFNGKFHGDRRIRNKGNSIMWKL